MFASTGDVVLVYVYMGTICSYIYVYDIASLLRAINLQSVHRPEIKAE